MRSRAWLDPGPVLVTSTYFNTLTGGIFFYLNRVCTLDGESPDFEVYVSGAWHYMTIWETDPTYILATYAPAIGLETVPWRIITPQSGTTPSLMLGQSGVA